MARLTQNISRFMAMILFGLGLFSHAPKPLGAEPASTETLSSPKGGGPQMILSAISEPEGGLIRTFTLDTSPSGEIEALTIKPEKGEIFRYTIEQLRKDEVLVSTLAGVKTVTLKVTSYTADAAMLQVNYLERIPSSWNHFLIHLRRGKDGLWALYRSDPQGGLVTWMVFHARTLLGAPVGVSSYDLLSEKPTKPAP